MKIFTRRFRHSTLWMFLVIMPVGIRVDGEHESGLAIEGHAGTGQLASVIRDCSGNPVASESNTFSDLAGGGTYSHHFGEGNVLVLGLRAGRFRMDLRQATREPVLVEPYEYEYTYWNPHLALESPFVGIGFGYLSEEPVLHFSDWTMDTPVTAHLRLGSYAAAHFLATYNENLPMISGGGHIILGMGYPAGGRASMFTGFSGYPYDQIGLVQKVSWMVSDRFDLDLNARAGGAAGHFEGSVSLGLRYHLPFGKKIGPNPFLEERAQEKSREDQPGHREIG